MTLRVRRIAQMRNHVSSKPFKHIAGRRLCQPAVHTAFTQEFPQLSGAKCARCVPRLGSTRGRNLLPGSRLSADSNMRPSPGAKCAENSARAETKVQKLVKRPIWSSC